MNGQKIEIGEKHGTFSVIGTEKDLKNKTVYVCKCDCGAVKKCIGYYVRLKRKCRFCKALNFIGKKNERTTFLKYIGNSEFECRCDCGKNFIGEIRSKSCGCHIEESYIEDAKSCIGITRNGLNIISFERFDFIQSKKARVAIFKAKCKCGKIFEISRAHINKIKSCGCRINCDYSRAEKHYKSRITNNEQLLIIELYLTGNYSFSDISQMIGTNSENIRAIIKRKSRKSVEIPKKIMHHPNFKEKIGCVKKHEEIIVGKKYGEWFVIKKSESLCKRTYYLCRCKCEREYKVSATSLRMKKSTRCRDCQKDWCKKYDYKSYVGKKIGSKLIIEHLNLGNSHKFRFKCDCGYENTSSASYIIRSAKNHCEKCYPRLRKSKVILTP